MNIIPEVAKLLGVKPWQEFNVLDSDNKVVGGSPYVFKDDSLASTQWPSLDSGALYTQVLNGKYKVAPIIEDESDQLYLCYVEGNTMYFTNNMQEVWGDDWDDSPYEFNAGLPYKRYIKATIVFEYGYRYDSRFACACGSGYSVEDINNGSVAWVTMDDIGSLYGGATLNEAKIWLRKAGLKWAELHD